MITSFAATYNMFATLFYFTFLLPVFSILRGEKIQAMSRGLVFVIITNNFVYLLSGILFLKNMDIKPQQQYHFRCPKQSNIVSVQLNRDCNGDKCRSIRFINGALSFLLLYGTPAEIQFLESFHAYTFRNHTLLYIYDGIQFVF